MITCVSCNGPVGAEEKRAGTLRLFKWNLALQRAQDCIWETLSVQEIVSAQLIALIEYQATTKFLTYSGNIEDAEDALLVSISYDFTTIDQMPNQEYFAD